VAVQEDHDLFDLFCSCQAADHPCACCRYLAQPSDAGGDFRSRQGVQSELVDDAFRQASPMPLISPEPR
jgi:hypothetical protein